MDSLIKRAMNHDVDAFVQLMEQNTPSMYKVARGFLRDDEDIADVIQDTILTCLEKIGTLRQEKYFKTWMIRILINHCKDLLKERKRTCPYDELAEFHANATAPQADLGPEWKDMLQRLDEKYRAIIILYYLEGFKISEISQLLDMNISTVKTRLSRGRKELQQLYKTENEKGRKNITPFHIKEVGYYVR